MPTVAEQFDNLQEEQINDQVPHNEIVANESIVNKPHEVALIRSQRQKRPAISDDYVVYLQE